LASLGNTTNVIKGLQHINDHTNNKCDKGLESLYYDISVDYKMVECGRITENTQLDQHTKDLSHNINKKPWLNKITTLG
jgi:hypothetical protein